MEELRTPPPLMDERGHPTEEPLGPGSPLVGLYAVARGHRLIF
jgi:hypothetical protein